MTDLAIDTGADDDAPVYCPICGNDCRTDFPYVADVAKKLLNDEDFWRGVEDWYSWEEFEKRGLADDEYFMDDAAASALEFAFRSDFYRTLHMLCQTCLEEFADLYHKQNSEPDGFLERTATDLDFNAFLIGKLGRAARGLSTRMCAATHNGKRCSAYATETIGGRALCGKHYRRYKPIADDLLSRVKGNEQLASIMISALQDGA